MSGLDSNYVKYFKFIITTKISFKNKQLFKTFWSELAKTFSYLVMILTDLCVCKDQDQLDASSLAI